MSGRYSCGCNIIIEPEPKPCPKLYTCPIERINHLRNRLHKSEPWEYIDGIEDIEAYEKGYLKTDEELYGKEVITMKELYEKGLLVRGSKEWEKGKEYYDNLKKDMNANIEKIAKLRWCFEEPCEYDYYCDNLLPTPSEVEQREDTYKRHKELGLCDPPHPYHDKLLNQIKEIEQMASTLFPKPGPCVEFDKCSSGHRKECLRDRLSKLPRRPPPLRRGIPWRCYDRKERLEGIDATLARLDLKGLLKRGSEEWEKGKEYYDNLWKDIDKNVYELWELVRYFEEPCKYDHCCSERPLTPSEQEERNEWHRKMWG